MRNLGILIVLILWILFGIKACTDQKACCGSDTINEEATPMVTPVPVKKTGPLMFNWSDATPVTSDAWPAYRDSIINALGPNQNLEITGYYRADEVNNTSFENLGIARADSIRQLFAGHLPADRITLIGKLTGEQDGDRQYLFESASFSNRVNTEKIKEVEDKTLIYFPFNSTNKLNDSEVEAYLNDVADRVKKTGESVRLTGYTDSIGDDASNLKLGQRRADVIKNYLVSRGVSAAKINAGTEGEAKPIATNDTSDGRAKNRRTELQIIK